MTAKGQLAYMEDRMTSGKNQMAAEKRKVEGSSPFPLDS